MFSRYKIFFISRDTDESNDLKWRSNVALSINGELTEPNSTTLNLYETNGLSGSVGSSRHKNLVKSISRQSSFTWRRYSRCLLTGCNSASTILHRGQSPTNKQSFRLACLGDWQQLQLYMILMGVVGEFFLAGW